ncbi:MAG: co-chaperone GroES [Candidatus Paceibacterota bacterium]|jgi:chaperonin GroES|nr:co-chaperone GroES [Candidatus Paceibacterota bacterium]
MSAKTKILPLADRVLVKPGNPNEGKKTKSGIIIPETVSKDLPEMGEVLAVGEGKILDSGEKLPMNVKVGDVVIFSKYGPDEVKIDGEKYFIIREEAILAVVK